VHQTLAFEFTQEFVAEVFQKSGELLGTQHTLLRKASDEDDYALVLHVVGRKLLVDFGVPRQELFFEVGLEFSADLHVLVCDGQFFDLGLVGLDELQDRHEQTEHGHLGEVQALEQSAQSQRAEHVPVFAYFLDQLGHDRILLLVFGLAVQGDLFLHLCFGVLYYGIGVIVLRQIQLGVDVQGFC